MTRISLGPYQAGASRRFRSLSSGLHNPPIQPLTVAVCLDVLAVIVAGPLIEFVPALGAYRNSLADGLTMRLQ